jgi:hypothetical protein
VNCTVRGGKTNVPGQRALCHGHISVCATESKQAGRTWLGARPGQTSPWTAKQRQLRERSWRILRSTASPTRVSLACTARILAHFLSRSGFSAKTSDTSALCRARCMIIVSHSVGDWLSRRGVHWTPELCRHIRSPRCMIITGLSIARSFHKRPVNLHYSFAPEQN